MAEPIRVVIQRGEAIELSAGWPDPEPADEHVIFLMPVRLRRRYLVPVGEPAGVLGLSIKLQLWRERGEA